MEAHELDDKIQWALGANAHRKSSDELLPPVLQRLREEWARAENLELELLDLRARYASLEDERDFWRREEGARRAELERGEWHG